MELRQTPHERLELAAIVTEFPEALGAAPPPPALRDLLSPEAAAPVASSDDIRAAVRDVLRLTGFKPTGRSKPASEYLRKAVGEGQLSSINWAVDACNAVSLHSGLPISVVDLDRLTAPLRVDVATEGTSYVFNASGQSIDVGGLLCLFDADGPCANAVKDAQRVKTNEATRRTLSLIWGCRAFADQVRLTTSWYRRLLDESGARTSDVLVRAT